MWNLQSGAPKSSKPDVRMPRSIHQKGSLPLIFALRRLQALKTPNPHCVAARRHTDDAAAGLTLLQREPEDPNLGSPPSVDVLHWVEHRQT
jgi:hypothetical protein